MSRTFSALAQPLRRLLGPLALFAVLLCGRPAAAEVPDVQVTVFSYPPQAGAPRDQVAVSYPNSKPSKEQVQDDFTRLAQSVGAAPLKVKISAGRGAEGFTTAEAELSGLVNWSNGRINLEGVLNTFRQYRYIQVYYLFFGSFPLPPAGEQDLEQARVRITPGGSGIIYDIWLKPSVAASTAPIRLERKQGAGPWVLMAAGATLLVVGLSGFLIWYVVAGQRRRPVRRETPGDVAGAGEGS